MSTRKPTAERGLIPQEDGTIRARVSFKGKNFERTFRTKDRARKWRAQFQADLSRCPSGITSVRNTWVAEIAHENGAVVEKFTLLDDAIEWFNETKAAIRTGHYVEAEFRDCTLIEFVPKWKGSKSRAGERTMLRYADLLSNQILPTFGTTRLVTISNKSVQAWIQGLQRAGVSSSNQRKALALLKNILKQAEIDGAITRAPIISVELPNQVKKTQRALTHIELNLLAKECGPYQDLVLVLGSMGLRISEARALTVADVDFGRNQLLVSKAFTIDATYKRVLGPTKTRQSRTIPIPNAVVEMLRARVKGKLPSAWIFTGSRGEPLSDGWFRKRWFNPAITELGLDEVTIHTLRHTCASLLIQQGAQITTVSRILGHSTVMQTLNTYGHYYQDDLETSLQLLDTTLSELRNAG